MRKVTAVLVLVSAWPAGAKASVPPSGGPCAGAPAKVEIAGPGEPGQRLRVRGRVFRPDGRTPAAGVTVYAYQTDATGLYARERGAPPRLRGFMTTDAEGRFEYATIRPAPYPTRTIAAHVHHQLWGGGFPPQWNEDLLFADDPLLSERERERSDGLGRFGGIRRPGAGAEGALEVEIELRLKPRGDPFEGGIRHGLEACGVEPSR